MNRKRWAIVGATTAAALVGAGPLYGGEVVGGVYGFASGLGLVAFLATRLVRRTA